MLDIHSLNLDKKIIDKFQEINQKFDGNILLKELFYNGFHNTTFLIELNNELYQLRINNNDFVDHLVEEKILKNNPDYIFYHQGSFLKKWFVGKTLNEIKVTKKIQLAVLKELKKFQSKTILDLPIINWYTYGSINKKYDNFVKELMSKNLVTTHGDLSPKNILINEKNQVKFIDFEWVRKNHFAFDLITLVENASFSWEIIKEVFNITDTEIKKITYVSQKFREYGYKKKYAHFDFQKMNLKEIEGGLSNRNFKLNNYFIQYKNQNKFNFKISTNKLNKLNFVPLNLYEDKKIIIRNFIDKQEINFHRKSILKQVAQNLKQLHTVKVKTKQSNIYKRVIFYGNKSNKWKEIDIFFGKKNVEKILNFIKNIPSEVLSHNDLNEANVLLDLNNKAWFIDFEYMGFNHPYFDLAYFSSATFLKSNEEKYLLEKYTDKIDYRTYYQYKCIVNFYGLIWMLYLRPNAKISDNKMNIKNIKKYLKYL
ncbi:phosphotransferase [Mycoplasmopsis columbina]|uniref:phosphotransferase n=1 Tax=Mycoplasmopsis columbina TaxID=114881 RepID=UPI0004A70FE0|nr:phosphotransferase [Mycoplasmopsis columbina]VEU76889.1 Choline/ethanolamine kinase [Mycoplasmopsis columbina]